MKHSILKLAAAAMMLTLVAGTAEQAAADVIVVPHVGNVQVMYDAAGIPIWGYGTRGRAIYAYSPEGLPVYSFAKVYSGCYVPTWDFLPTYHGPRWPRGIHRKGHGNFRPRPGVYGPNGQGPHHGTHKPAPAPKPGAHKPNHGGDKPAMSPSQPGNKPGAHKPEASKPGSHKPAAKPGANKPKPGGSRR